MADVDCVVIGSGAGGMAAAVALAQAGQRVVVFEQHEVPGGWCHSFTLGGYRFSPGVHYVGQLQPGGQLRRIYEGLGVSGDLAFFELNPDGFDKVRLAGRVAFDIPKGRERLADSLGERFPRQRKQIARYLRAVERIGDQLAALSAMSTIAELATVPWAARTMLRHIPYSLSGMLSHYGVDDPAARAILSVQAGDHGLPPDRAPAVIHSAIAHHYFHGGYYPKGGGYTIPRAFNRALLRAGGQVKLRSSVHQIITEGGGRSLRAIGVRLADGTEIRADRVVSNADPTVTFDRLIGRERLPGRLRKRLARLRYGTSALSLFLAIDTDPRALGLDSGNIWYSPSIDVNDMYPGGPDAEIRGLFLTATSLKDPARVRKDGHHTLEAFAFIDYRAFEQWAPSSVTHRPEDYSTTKNKLMAEMIAMIDAIVPELSRHIVFAELGTPLSNVHYCQSTRGSLYGTEKSVRQTGPFAFLPKSQIHGLYLCGASTLSGHGVMGATLSGLDVAQQILGISKAEMLTRNGPALSLQPAEPAP